MDFHPSANLVEFLNCPAGLSAELESQAESLAFRLANELGIVGLLAVEMFVNNDGTIWINEMAPRPHNSGHHTLDNGATSQFANHIRAISGLPLGHTHGDRAAIMINLIGEKDYSGPVRYQGMESCLELDGVHLHLYGKSETKPFRKMGHITVTGMDLDECRRKANFVSNTIKVIS
jgi:5-(carboxyamino)imidazole ribonucleotide synthase